MAKKICSLGWTKTTIEEIQRIRSIQKMIDNKAFQSQGRGQPQSQLYILLYCRQQAFKYKVVWRWDLKQEWVEIMNTIILEVWG